MSWPSPIEPYHTTNSSPGMPYNSVGSFMDLFGHVNFIFSDGHPYNQEGAYSSMNTSLYKFGFSEPASFYCDYGHGHMVNDHSSQNDDFSRNMDNLSTVSEEAAISECLQPQVHSGFTAPPANSVARHRNHQNSHEYEVVWQDDVDIDNMTYEELLELGESVGTQSRGLSQDLISMLPVSKFKCSLFSRKKSRKERCVICQMEYKRGSRQMTLPCKHVYHVRCGSRWLSINKACPICYKEVSLDAINKSD